MTNKERLIEEIVKRLEKLDEIDLLEESLRSNELHKIEEMSQMLRLDKMFVSIYGGERDVAHFHIYTTDGRKSCLKFEENAYFAHGDCKDKLDAKELKLLMKEMQKKSKDDPSKTNWEMCIFIWNIANRGSTQHINADLKMPNYKDPRYPK